MRTLEYDAQQHALLLVDQTLLPHETVMVTCRTAEDVAHAIRSMQVRGAPAIGVTAAYGMVLGARAYSGSDAQGFVSHLQTVDALLRKTRPTAVNLHWALDRTLVKGRAVAERDGVEAAQRELLQLADVMAEEDIEANRKMHEAGRGIHVYVDETRPFLQGARLTAWELTQLGVPMTLITDSMAGHFMSRGKVDLVVVGADRIAANGDVANKIGTYSLAVIARENGIPFYVAAPISTVDLALASGADIPIEERSSAEVVEVSGRRIAPEGVTAAHPAFDVTPNRMVTAIITEHGVLRAPYEQSLADAVRGAAAPVTAS